MSRVILEKAKFVPNWTSIIGAVAGAARARGDDRPVEYLMGMTGFAFRLHVRDAVCPSSVTTGYRWTDDVLHGIERLGWRGEAYFIPKENPAFDNVQSEVCRRITRSIDDGQPVVVWETVLPEFGLVRGYDPSAEVFYLSGVRDREREETIKYAELGTGDVPILYALFLMDRVNVDPKAKELEAVRWAAGYFADPPVNPADELHGVQCPAAYEKWAAELAANRAGASGNAYLAQVTASARETVGPFLRDVAKRHKGIAGPLSEAAGVYDKVAGELRTLAGTFPFPGDESTLADKVNRDKGTVHLHAAENAEKKAVEIIASAVK